MGFRVSSYCWARKNGIVLLFGCCNLEFNGGVVNVDYWKSGHINNRWFRDMWFLKMEGGFELYKRDTAQCKKKKKKKGSNNWDGFEDDFNGQIQISFFNFGFCWLEKNSYLCLFV